MPRTHIADRTFRGTDHEPLDRPAAAAWAPRHDPARGALPGPDAFELHHGMGNVHVSDNEDLMQLHAQLGFGPWADTATADPAIDHAVLAE